VNAKQKQLAMMAGAIGAIALCFIGVLLLRRDDPSPYDDSGRARHPVGMSSTEAEEYLRRVKYPHVRSSNGGRLVIGQDSYCSTDEDCRSRRPKIVFDYSEGLDRPRCITVTHSYTLDWRAIAGKLGGIDGDKLPGFEADYRQVVRAPIGDIKVIVKSLMHLEIGTDC
jgi:hypothetical protein